MQRVVMVVRARARSESLQDVCDCELWGRRHHLRSGVIRRSAGRNARGRYGWGGGTGRDDVSFPQVYPSSLPVSPALRPELEPHPAAAAAGHDYTSSLSVVVGRWERDSFKARQSRV